MERVGSAGGGLHPLQSHLSSPYPQISELKKHSILQALTADADEWEPSKDPPGAWEPWDLPFII